VDQVLLACFHYDPSSGRYSMTIMTLVRAAGLLTVGLIAGAIVVLRRRERRGPLPSNAHA
jgi:protein SCO1/2